MLLALLVVATARDAAFTDAQRIVAKEAIERARYVFVLGEKPPFDTRYPHSFFIKQLHEEREREAVLERVFGLSPTLADLEHEYERIEKTTRAPDQWEAIKAAVHNDRRMIEEVFCRPLLVERVLRAKFDFDPTIHAGQHAAARGARAEFLEGRKPAGAVEQTMSRKPGAEESTGEMLERARRESAVPRILKPGAPPENAGPIPLEPEALALLEKELHKAGDVSTILEYRDRFEVYRLIEATPAGWRVEAVRFPKQDFDTWYETVRRTTRSRVLR